MKPWKPTWDILVTLSGVALLLGMSLRNLLPATLALPLERPGTFFALTIACGVLLFVGLTFGTLRHKEASPIILSGMGLLCLLLPLPTSLLLQGIAVVSFAATAVLTVTFRAHSLDIPRAPSMEDLMHDAL